MSREGDGGGGAACRGHSLIARLMACRVKEQILAMGKPLTAGCNSHEEKLIAKSESKGERKRIHSRHKADSAQLGLPRPLKPNRSNFSFFVSGFATILRSFQLQRFAHASLKTAGES